MAGARKRHITREFRTEIPDCFYLVWKDALRWDEIKPTQGQSEYVRERLEFFWKLDRCN
jgi:hypothetical protein